jgi:hypothetical protein
MALVADLQCLADDLHHRTYYGPTNEVRNTASASAWARSSTGGKRPSSAEESCPQPTVERLF